MRNIDFILSEIFNIDKYEKDTGKKIEDDISLTSEITENGAIIDKYLTIDFDENFYRNSYEDLDGNTVVDALEHFLKFGYKEGRVPSESVLEDLQSNLQIIADKHSKIFSRDFFDPLFDIREFLMRGDRGESIINQSYLNSLKDYYPLTLRKGSKFFLGFEIFHPSEIKNEQDIEQHWIKTISESSHFSEIYYKTNSHIISSYYKLDLIKHFICEGHKLFLDPSSYFSTYSYLIGNSDLVQPNFNVLIHYIVYGEKEGRQCGGNFIQKMGIIKHDPNKPNILVSAHEASRTGAPIVSLELSRTYKKNYNVILWLGKDGPLLDEFLENTCFIHIQEMKQDLISKGFEALFRTYDFEFVIANSAESYPLAFESSKYKIPIVSLVHEFSEYARPRGRIASLACISDLVVVPAEIIKESLFQDMRYLGFTHEKINILVQHQGCALNEDLHTRQDKLTLEYLRKKKAEIGAKKLMLGCGWVQPRKGINKFLEVAKKISQTRDDVIFVWVGANYLPETDMSYSVYINDFVNRANLGGKVLFINQVENLSPFWAEADLFFMSSLLDPFPNVAIDAIVRNIPTICFDKTTGIAELKPKFPESIYVADYMDSESAAKLSLELLESPKPNVDKSELTDYFSYDSYIKAINKALQNRKSLVCNSNVRDVPKWLLNKANINFIYDVDEKKELVRKFLSRMPGDVKITGITTSADRRMINYAEEGEFFVVIDPYLNEEFMSRLLAFIRCVQEKLINVKVFVLKTILDRLYLQLLDKENYEKFELLNCETFEEAEKEILQRYNRRNIKLFNIIYDQASHDSLIHGLDYLYATQDKVVGEGRSFSFGLDGFMFWDDMRNKNYCPSVKYKVLE